MGVREGETLCERERPCVSDYIMREGTVVVVDVIKLLLEEVKKI